MDCCNGSCWIAMKKPVDFYFMCSLVLGTTIYLFQRFDIALPEIINNYLNDFLIIPIILTSCLHLLRWSKNDKNYQISLPVILYLCTLYSVLFEYYFPKVMERYTADIIDVGLYFTSGILFYYLQKRTK